MQEVNIVLDSKELKKLRLNRRYHYNVIQIPALRFAGFLFMAIMLNVHNLANSASAEWGGNFAFFIIAISYCSLSWIILYLLFEKFHQVNIGDIFLLLDLILIVLAIYWSGGHQSFLIFILVARVVDQAYSTLKRIMFFCHYIILCYLVMLMYIHFVDRVPLDWMNESIKMLIVYLFSIYVSLTAREFIKTRNVKNSAIKRAKDELIQRKKVELELREKNRHLRDALEEIKVLRGIHPICSFCKKIRDNKGIWNHIENYIRDRSEATFSHSVCPDCARINYPDLSYTLK